VTTFNGLVAPAGTPKDIVKLLNATINEGLQAKENQETIARLGAVSNLGSPEAFAEFIAAQNRKWRDVAKAANVKID
jgi:tripartite-type tricarboxylate transporter receptor subunit TctC